MPQNVLSRRRGVLAGSAALCALAGSILAAGPAAAAPSQPSFGCATQESPTQAYLTWQGTVVTQATSYATYGVQAPSPPEWLASFDTMTTNSPNTQNNDDGLNWFTWVNDGVAGEPYVQQAFGTPSSYIMESSPDQVSNSGYFTPPAMPTTMQVYKSAWDLISALDPGAFGGTQCGAGLDSDVGAVMYDDEDWTGTPAIEQEYPGYYVAMIAYYVHQYNTSDPPPAHQLKFFVAPAFDLTNAINTVETTTGSGASGYLTEHIPELVATPSTTWRPDQGTQSGTDGNFGSYVPDDVDIQAQQDEPVVNSTLACPSTPLPYWCIVRTAATQIASGDQGATLFAGLTTNNAGGNGAAATPGQLQAAAASVQGTVSGFWLNDPASSSACLQCTGTYPDIADQSLNGIDTSW